MEPQVIFSDFCEGNIFSSELKFAAIFRSAGDRTGVPNYSPALTNRAYFHAVAKIFAVLTVSVLVLDCVCIVRGGHPSAEYGYSRALISTKSPNHVTRRSV